MAKGRNKNRAKAAKAKAKAAASGIPTPKHLGQRLKVLSISNAKNSPLIKLPAEIRIMIFLYVLDDRSSVFMAASSRQDMECNHRDPEDAAGQSRGTTPKIFQQQCLVHKAQQWALLRVCRHTRFDVLSLGLSQDNYRAHNITCISKLSVAERPDIKTLLLQCARDPFSCSTCYSFYGVGNLDFALPQRLYGVNKPYITLSLPNLREDAIRSELECAE